MSEIKNIFDISGRAMASQLVRLNTVASNLANAGTIASTKEEAFRALKPVFQTTYADQLKHSGVSTVDVVTVAEVTRAPEKAFMPHHPSADAMVLSIAQRSMRMRKWSRWSRQAANTKTMSRSFQQYAR